MVVVRAELRYSFFVFGTMVSVRQDPKALVRLDSCEPWFDCIFVRTEVGTTEVQNPFSLLSDLISKVPFKYELTGAVLLSFTRSCSRWEKIPTR